MVGVIQSCNRNRIRRKFGARGSLQALGGLFCSGELLFGSHGKCLFYRATLTYRWQHWVSDPLLLSKERVECFICEIHVRSQFFNHVFVFAQMKMDGRFELLKWKVLQVNSSLYFAQYVHLVISNIIREIRCEVIYLFIHLINHLNPFWILSALGGRRIGSSTCPYKQEAT